MSDAHEERRHQRRERDRLDDDDDNDDDNDDDDDDNDDDDADDDDDRCDRAPERGGGARVSGEGGARAAGLHRVPLPGPAQQVRGAAPQDARAQQGVPGQL